MKKATPEDAAARKRARTLFIESKGQAAYDDIALQLRLEGLGEIKIDTLRQWRLRDIKAGSVKPEELAREFDRIGKQADKVAQTLQLPSNLTLAEKIECAKLADLEDTHERMLRVVNAAAEKLEREIPDMNIGDVKDATTLSMIAERIADSSIKLRLALVQVRDQQMKLIGASDDKGNPVHAEIIAPNKPAGLNDAVSLFRQAG
jgi:hypothetical protein